MKRAMVLALTVLAISDATAAVRRLATDCTIPASFVPSEATPYDLDWCTLYEKDDVHQLLIDLANRWPGKLYVRAPSRTISLESNTTNWTKDVGAPVMVFMFLEDQNSANRLTLNMRADPRDKYVLWQFDDFKVVKIGGPNLSITFVGTHPGLANGNPETNNGLLNFRLSNGPDGNSPDLLDVRANVRMAEDYGLVVKGDAYAQQLGGTANRIKQVNVSGLYWNAPVVFLGGVSKIWLDPDGFRVSDPYARTMGWDGVVAKTEYGIRIGCSNYNLDQIRTSAGSPNHFDELTGGVTIEWGGLGFTPRNGGRIGKSQADPFVIRIKDLGMTGPGTGYPEGVRVKPSGEALFFKGDPAGEMGNTAPFRFIRFESLPSKYGLGIYPNAIADGLCAPGTPSNNFASGRDNFMRLEANRNGQPYRSINSYYDIEFKGDWTGPFTVNGNLYRGPLLYTAYRPEDSPGPVAPDRSYGHVIRVASDTTISDTIPLHDTITATGPGAWTNLAVASVSTVGTNVRIPAKNNRILDTNVSGAISVEEGSVGTVIKNVRFSGAARKVLTVGADSDVTVSQLCAPAGSSIDGAGRVQYEGVTISLPYVLGAVANCGSLVDAQPAAPTNVMVE